jgi:hypothetical protein
VSDVSGADRARRLVGLSRCQSPGPPGPDAPLACLDFHDPADAADERLAAGGEGAHVEQTTERVPWPGPDARAALAARRVDHGIEGTSDPIVNPGGLWGTDRPLLCLTCADQIVMVVVGPGRGCCEGCMEWDGLH